MEGKETRFGINADRPVRHHHHAASCGAVNAMHDSFTPLGRHGAAGDDAAGRSGVRRRRHRPVRHAGLRHPGGVHRRPDDRPHAGIPGQEDRGLRDEDDVDRHPGDAAAGAGWHRHRRDGRCRQAGIANPGAHGFSEILYAFTSAANNNGSAFAGLSANTPFYNTMLGLPCGSAASA
jgi:K+-transporting ATPase ATPase A chain